MSSRGNNVRMLRIDITRGNNPVNNKNHDNRLRNVCSKKTIAGQPVGDVLEDYNCAGRQVEEY